MPRTPTLIWFFVACFLQAGAYGMTFLLPKLFAGFGLDEKAVGLTMFMTALATLTSVYYSGHLSERFDRLNVLGAACFCIATSLLLFPYSSGTQFILGSASILLGVGWGLTYTLAPIVLTTTVTADDRVRYFAILSVAIMAGFGLAPVLAATFEDIGFAIGFSFLLTAALCICAGVIFLCLRSLDSGSESNVSPGDGSRLSPKVVGSIIRSPAKLPIFMVCIGACVFAGMNNFQTVFADERGLRYGDYFLAYTVTVVVFRLVLAKFKGGRIPYLTISLLLYVMMASISLFIFVSGSAHLYVAVAFLFGIGYGVSYPILAATAAHDAESVLLAPTLQLFALAYFFGIFCFPLLAGWIIVEFGSLTLLVCIAILSGIEATLALSRGLSNLRLREKT